MPYEAQAGPEILSETAAEGDRLADAAQFGADILCDTRPLQARLVESVIQKEDYQSWKLAGAVALIGVLDKVDGMLARFAAKRRGLETTAEGAESDQKSDKKWTYIMLGALAARAFRDGDTEYGAFLTANQTIIRTRDQMVNEKREEAQIYGVDAKAQKAGKVKTFAQNLTFTFMTSPLAKSKWGKRAAYAMQTVSTGLSVKSGKMLIKSLDDGIAEVKEPLR